MMLVIRRRREEEIVITGGIRIKVISLGDGQVGLAFTAPADIKIWRAELNKFAPETAEEFEEFVRHQLSGPFQGRSP